MSDDNDIVNENLGPAEDGRISHGLMVTAETFFKAVDQKYVDYYHGVFESLCEQFEHHHLRDPFFEEKDDLEKLAFNKTKLKMAREYEANKAIEENLPLTEKQVKDIGGQPVEVEKLSKMNELRRDVRRENRLLKKELDLYGEPQRETETDEADPAEIWVEDIED
jgi:hypothetical protein